VTAFLTVAAVAEELDVSIRTVQRWIERDHLPAVRLPGGRLRVARRDLDEALAQWRTAPPGRMLAA
jgi:excisionase family DNA binding protein